MASAAHLPGEEFSLATTAAPGTLQVGLGGEFLDVAARVLEEAVPRDGSFCIPNATSPAVTFRTKSTTRSAGKMPAPSAARPSRRWSNITFGRCWARSESEDVWEAIFRVAINAESQAIVELPDVFQEPDLLGEDTGDVAGDPGHIRHRDRGRKTAADQGVGRIRSPRRTEAGAGPQAVAGLLSSLVARGGRARSVARRRFPHLKKSRPRSGPWIWNCVASWRKWMKTTPCEPSCGRWSWPGFVFPRSWFPL